ncbi:hypothetical protein [Pseudoxanthomonas putridarboris]|uniref:Uncharacterized protein n=1 Tax=Pseudoxanthomonas putridarboris TaxID=752605 RepID=A0ABU9J558_9GAMM
MLNALEKAWEWEWALRLIGIVLFIDAAMVVRSQHGLLDWPSGNESILNSLGLLLIAIAGFSVAVAIAMPVLFEMFRRAMWSILAALPSFPSSRERHQQPYQRPLGWAPARKLRDRALRDKDEFLLDLYNKHESGRRERERERERIGDLTASVVLLASIDGWVGYRLEAADSVVSAAVAFMGIWVAPAILLLSTSVFALLKASWFSLSTADVIYYPPLDDELRKVEREERRL